MMYNEQLITTPNGDVVEVATVGNPDGHTVFFHHGTPGSAPFVASFADVVGPANIFLVTMSRPGYGNSSRRERRDVASVVGDVTVVLDALQRDQYVSVGWSGGGPHALACAALDSPRCLAAWSLAGVVPTDVDFDWTEGMGPENLEEFALAVEGGPRYDDHMALACAQFREATSDNVIELFGGLLSEVDKTALRSASTRSALAASCRHAFANGVGGYHDDDRAFFSAWGFDVGSITVPVSVWYGDEDLMVPPTHGAWLTSHLPSASVVHHPHEGHISLVTNHVESLFSSIALAFH